MARRHGLVVAGGLIAFGILSILGLPGLGTSREPGTGGDAGVVVVAAGAPTPHDRRRRDAGSSAPPAPSLAVQDGIRRDIVRAYPFVRNVRLRCTGGTCLADGMVAPYGDDQRVVQFIDGGLAGIFANAGYPVADEMQADFSASGDVVFHQGFTSAGQSLIH